MKNLENATCPSCGSNNTAEVVEQSYITVPYAKQAAIENKSLHCNDCNMDIDISDSRAIQEAINKVTSESVEGLINSLVAENNWTLASIEHALDLPERTLSRWKAKSQLSKESITLLRILKTYPWIVEVADQNYDVNSATMAIFKVAVKMTTEMMRHLVQTNQAELKAWGGITQGGAVEFGASYFVPPPNRPYVDVEVNGVRALATA